MAHPRKYEPSSPLIARLRKICLALPGAFEKEAWGECTFRVAGGSMFAMTDCNHHDSGHTAVWIKAPVLMQEALTSEDAERFFVPPYLGAKGWVGVRIDRDPDWADLGEMLKDGYLLSVPKRRATRRTTDGAAPARRTRKKRASRHP
jgi:predicted DNA-binding protein (MmcQ/YjbR family)